MPASTPSTIPPRRLDSIEEVHLTLLPTFTHTENTSLCAGDSLQRWGRWFKATGTYSQAFATQNGCDSTEVLQPTVNPLITDSRQVRNLWRQHPPNGIEYSTAGSIHHPTTGHHYAPCLPLPSPFRIASKNRKIQVMPRWFHQHKWPMDRWNPNPSIYPPKKLKYHREITAEISLLPQDTSTRRELLCPGDSILHQWKLAFGNQRLPSYTLNGSDGCDSS